jgi:hypothetical protein
VIRFILERAPVRKVLDFKITISRTQIPAGILALPPMDDGLPRLLLSATDTKPNTAPEVSGKNVLACARRRSDLSPSRRMFRDERRNLAQGLLARRRDMHPDSGRENQSNRPGHFASCFK